MDRLILHIDLNSCFASCEQQDNPAWRHRPLGVVQDSGQRSIIIAASIEAKALGIGTGTPVWEAKQLCPMIQLVPARFERYVYYSRLFRCLCADYSDKVETFSIDELFLDISQTAHLFGAKNLNATEKQKDGALTIAWLLKRRLTEEVGDYLRCSVGIAPNKMLAKLASGSQKPDGLVFVGNKDKIPFLDSHPLWHICGIGNRIVKRLNRLGVFTVAQMRQIPQENLVREFGILGNVYARWALGEDDDPVLPFGKVALEKSYGHQVTLPKAVSPDQALSVLLWLCWQVTFRMRRHQMSAKTVSVFVRGEESYDYAQKTVLPCSTPIDLYQAAAFIFQSKLQWNKAVRFLGVSASNLQPALDTSLPLLEKEQKWHKISMVWDAMSLKYDPFLIYPARLLGKNLHKSEYNGFSKKF